MFIQNNLKLLLKNTIPFKNHNELNNLMIQINNKDDILYHICKNYLQYYNRCKRLTIIENSYHELLAEVSRNKQTK